MEFDNTLAMEEGWAISKCSVIDEPYLLEKIDEYGLFDTDAKVWEHVYNLAEMGSVYHQKAISFLESNSPKEFSRIDTFYESNRGVKTIKILNSRQIEEISYINNEIRTVNDVLKNDANRSFYSVVIGERKIPVERAMLFEMLEQKREQLIDTLEKGFGITYVG